MLQEFVNAIENKVKQQIQGVHTAMPGEVVSYDTKTGLATVLPKMKYKLPNGDTVDYPQIYRVPVMFPQAMGQEATIAFPVKAGDSCLIIIAEQSIDYWLFGQVTATDLAFDLTNAFCIPGLFNKANSVVADACAANSVVMDVKGTRLTVKNGSVEIKAEKVRMTGDLVVDGEIRSKGEKVSLDSHTHTDSNGGNTSSAQ